MRRSKAHALHPVNRIRQGIDNLVRYANDPHDLLRFLGSSPWDYLPQSPAQDSHYVYHRYYDFRGLQDVDLTDTWKELKTGTGTYLTRGGYTAPEYAHAYIETGSSQYDFYTYQEKYISFELKTPPVLAGEYYIDRIWVEFSFMLEAVDTTELFVGFAEDQDTQQAYDANKFGGRGGGLFTGGTSIGWRLGGKAGTLYAMAYHPTHGTVVLANPNADGVYYNAYDDTWVNVQLQYFYTKDGPKTRMFVNGVNVGILDQIEDHVLNKDLHLSFGIRTTSAAASKLWIRHIKYILPKAGIITL